MASSGINNGTLIAVYVGGVKIAHLTSNDLSIEQALRDASTKDSGGWTANLPAMRSWSCSAEGLFAENAAFGFDELFAHINNRTSFAVLISSQVSGDKQYGGTAYLSNLSQSAPLEDNQSFSVSITGSGALSETTVTP